MEIYVDADACPVKEEVIRVAERHRLPIHMVSNKRLRLTPHFLVRQVIVAEGMNIADDWIVTHVTRNDIVITADIPLAARCLEKAARVIGPSGKPFDPESIGMALAMRDLNAQLREVGIINGNSATFEKKDRSRFLRVLEETIQAILRGR